MQDQLDDIFPVLEVDDGPGIAGALFQRRYREQAPDFPHHMVGFWLAPDGQRHPACYIHFTPSGDFLLGGGACSDNRLLRRLPAGQRDLLRSAGGIYHHTLHRSLQLFSDRYSAVFGYVGDALSYRVTCAAGFSQTAHRHLLVHFTRPLPPARQHELIAQANAIGPF